MNKRKWFVWTIIFAFIAFILYKIWLEEYEKNKQSGEKEALRQPYHSSSSPGVYHLCANCISGSRISAKNRTRGTGGGELCKFCKDLIETGNC